MAKMKLLAFKDGAFDFRGIGNCFPYKPFFWIVRFVYGDFYHGNPARGLRFDAGKSSEHFFGVIGSFDSLEGFFFRGAGFSKGDGFGYLFFLFFTKVESDSREGAYFALGDSKMGVCLRNGCGEGNGRW